MALSTVNLIKNVANDCVFDAMLIDRDTIENTLGGTFGGSASIQSVTSQLFPRDVIFDQATNDLINFGDIQLANMGTQDFSIELIFKRESGVSGTETMFAKRNGLNTADVGFLVFMASTGHIRCELSDGTNEASVGANGDILDDGSYHHLIFTCDRDGDMTRYLDGTLNGSANSIASVGSITNTRPLMVSANSNNGLRFTGNIALSRLWNRVLTTDEITMLAKTYGFSASSSYSTYFDLTSTAIHYWPLGNIQDTTVTDIIGTTNGTATSMTEANVVDGVNDLRFALNLDGSADFVTIGDLTGTTIAGISLWVNLDSTTESLMQFSSTDYIDVTTGTIGVTGLTNASIYVDGILTSTITASQWHQVVVMFDAITDADDLLIGKENANFYDGQMMDVILFSQAKTGLQVELLYKHQHQGKLI